MQRKTVVILVFVLLSSALLGSSLFTRGHFWGDDFAAYIMQAKSILSGDMDDFVIANTFTVTKSSHQIGPAAYPWGYPLMLAPVYMLTGLNLLALKLPGLLTYLGFLIVFFFLTKRRFSLTESLLAVSLFAFNPGLLHFLDNIASDIPFLFFSTLAIFLADLYTHEVQKGRRRMFAILTGAAIFSAFFVRTQGLILLGSVILYQGLRFLGQREQRRQLLTDLLVITMALTILWGLSILAFPGGQGSYLALYSGFSMEILTGNILAYSKLFGDFFTALPGQTFIFGIFSILFFTGLVKRFKADLLFVLYAALYLIVLWSWPEWQGYRFIFPLLPFFIYFAFHGLRSLLDRESGKERIISQKFSYALLALMIALFAIHAGIDAYANLRANREINGPFDPFSMETYEFINNETPPDSTIVFFKPRAMRLMTGRDSLALTDCERIPEGDYLALSKKVGENLQIPPERIGECNLSLVKVFENRRFVVYQILK